MASASSPPPLARGTYSRPATTDLRGPCPLVNCLANHGYISRDGRNVRAAELTAAMKEVGLSRALGAVFANPIFLEHWEPGHDAQRPRTLWAKIWYWVRNPWAIAFAAFGMRRPGQEDSMGVACLDLTQLALPGVVEHDISLTRRDYAQGDNLTIQPDLAAQLIASSSDGGKTLSAQDLAELRKRRIEEQKQVNPTAKYGSLQHGIGCTEIALVLNVFGDGERVPCDYARAIFVEERLPRQEGWTKRRWWTLGLLELARASGKIKKLVGLQI